MAVALRCTQSRVAAWPIWTLRPVALGYVLVVDLLALGATAAAATATPWRARDAVVFVVLVGCALACIEASRESREAAGIVKDLLSVWTLPVALLLPPFYGLLVAVPLLALKQIHTTSGLVYRRIFTMAAIGLANLAAAELLRSAMGVPIADVGGSLLDGPPAHVSVIQMVLLALAAGAAGAAINLALVASAARVSVPELTYCDLLGDRESRILELGEVCLGVVVMACLLQTLVLAVVMIPPTLLVQRSLTHAQLQAAARSDAKTGLLNATAWQQEAELLVVGAAQRGLPLAILIIDLDHFKTVNDRFGHLVGDQVLAGAAAVLRENVRDRDVIGRFGGEEFTVCLPDTTPSEASQIAERLRRLIASTPTLLDNDQAVTVTASIGLALHRYHGDEVNDLLAAADAALYRAKGDGRNTLALAPGFPLEPSALELPDSGPANA